MSKVSGIGGKDVVTGKGNEAFASKLRDLMELNERGELSSLALVGLTAEGEVLEWYHFEPAQRHVFHSAVGLLSHDVAAKLNSDAEYVRKV